MRLMTSCCQKSLNSCGRRFLDHAVKSAQQESALLEPLVELGVACAHDEKYQMARRRWRQAVEFCPTEHPD